MPFLSTLSIFSLRRGVLTPERICRLAASMGYDAVALADRDNLYALPEFRYQAEQAGVRAVIGAEVSDPASGETVLVYARGHEGYASLCGLLSARHCEEHFRLTDGLVAFAEGLVVVSDSVDVLRSISGKCQIYFRIRRQRRVPPEVVSLGFTPVVIPDMAFADPGDHAIHRLLRAIDCNTSLSRLSEHQCLPENALLRPWEVVRDQFEVFEEALDATEELGRSIRSRDQFGTIIFPQADSEKDAVELLRYKVCEGARERYPLINDEVYERIEYELGIIESKGFASYFLIVDDIVAQSPRTCGRGSGAASIVAYCLGITNVDPIRYNLMFERFLNPGRIDPPDIDIDFAWDERDDVLDYVFRKYGEKHAAMVCTHGTFGMRAALREVARVYGFTEAEISAVTRRLPHLYDFGGEADIDEAIATTAAMRGIELDPPWPEVITYAQRLLGMPSTIGTHPGGVVITPGPIRREAPVQYSAKGYPIIQWEKDGAEEMGLVKIDLLGNRSLAVIRDALANLEREGVSVGGPAWDPASDGPTIDLLGRGKTMGVFYVESPAMRLLQEKTQAGDFEHLTIHSSLIRPAANRHNREYIRRLRGGEYEPIHPLLEDTLSETYGIMVYQEDVTRVAMQLADFPVVDAEGLRKIMAKKARRGKLEDYRDMFQDGARRKGLSQNAIDHVWDMMMAFSGYSFCKPHSASYVQVSFQSAWLKVHYPAAFLAAVISNFGGFYSTQAYISEAQRLALTVVPPDINQSAIKSYSRGIEVVVGLQLIKSLRDTTQKTIVRNREAFGPYATISDLLERTAMDESDAESLVLAGACDCLEPDRNRSQLFWKLRAFYRSRASDPAVPELTPYSRLQTLACEYDMLGFLAATHPITLVRPRDIGNAIAIKMIKAYVGRRVTFYGWSVTSRTLTTTKGEGMQFVTFEDETGIVESVLFPKVYAEYTRHVVHHEAFRVWGEVAEDFGSVFVNVHGLAPVDAKVPRAEAVRRSSRAGPKYGPVYQV